MSYPTAESRRERIAEQLDCLDAGSAPTDAADVVDRPRRGEISADNVLAQLEGR